MRAALLIAALLLPGVAYAAPLSSCLPELDQPTALARSIAEGVAMGVTDGSPWWGVAQNSTNQWCVVMEPLARGNGYDFTANPIPSAINGVAPNAVGNPTGLTAPELTTVIIFIPQSAGVSGQAMP